MGADLTEEVEVCSVKNDIGERSKKVKGDTYIRDE
jgi:hypothetical protein